VHVPGPSTQTFWPVYDGDHKRVLRFFPGNNSVIRDDFREDAIAFFFDKPPSLVPDVRLGLA
jgi:hypothetical protein